MKKVISIFVIVAMLAAFMMPSAFATEGEVPQIIVSSAETVPGGEIRLTVSLKNNPGITNGKITVTYDATALELVAFDFENECTWRGLIDGNVNNGEVGFVTTADTTKDHVLFEVILKVKENAVGDFNVGLTINYIKNNAEEDVVFEGVEGVVTSVCQHTNIVHMDAVEPACHFDGHIEYWYCATCDAVWQDEALTQLTNHKNVIIPALGGEVVYVPAKAATCYENGNIEHWYCEQCEQVWQDEALTQLTNHKNVIIAAYHENLVHMDAVAPGCHSNGNVEYWFCPDCEGFWTDAACTQVTNSKSVILPATGSENLVHMEAVAPGCHSNGNVEYWFCPDCEGFWTDAACTQVTNSKSVILPATGSENLVHFEAVEPGCHYNGNIEYWFCPDCEGFWTDAACTQVTNSKSVILPAHGGDVVHVAAVAPTCYSEGNIEYWYCEECEQVWQDEALTQLTNFKNVILPMAEHDLVHIDAVAPACHFDGNIEYWYCTVCDMVWQDEALTQLTNHKNVIVPALGGDVVHVEAKAPTCTEEGNIEHWYCEECEQVWQDAALTQLTNHMNVILPMAEHTLVHMEAVAPACHFDGNIEYWYCTVCDMVWQDEALTQLTNHKNVIVPALGGDVVHVEAKAPTCTEEGNIEHWYCEECEQVWQDAALTQLTNHMNVILPMAEHTLVHMEAVAPACHFDGHIEHWYCTVCDMVWQDEALTQLTNHKNVIVPALGGEVVHVEAKAPTCTEEGNIEHWYCEECEQVWQDEALTQLTNHKNVILPMAEHTIVHMEAVAPACHFDGHIEHWYCTVCDMVWQDEALTQLTNHKNVIVPALGGEVVHVEAKAPTCTEEGNIEHWYCEECEQVWQNEALTQLTNHMNVKLGATGHNFVDGVCTVCGEADPEAPNTGDSIFVAIAVALISGLGVVALTTKKREF